MYKMFEFDPERAHKAIRKAKVQVFIIDRLSVSRKNVLFSFQPSGKTQLS